VVALAERLGLPTVPLVFRGTFASSEQLQQCLQTWAAEASAVGADVHPEGFVVRRTADIRAGAFEESIAKYVRAGHIQTDETWRRRWKKARLGPALPARPPRLVEDPLHAKLRDPRQRHRVTAAGVGEVELQRNFSFLVEDVAVSSTPKHRQQILAMASLGITLVITLTEETPLRPEWFDGSGVQNLFVPVANFHPPTVPQMDQILEAIVAVALSGQKAMVHCGGGKGRAGTVAACMLLRYGLNGVGAAAAGPPPTAGGGTLCQMQSDEVITLLREARPGSIETARQEHFIREYASLLWRRAAEAPEAPNLLRQLSRDRSEREEDGLVRAQLFADDITAKASPALGSAQAGYPSAAVAAEEAPQAQHSAMASQPGRGGKGGGRTQQRQEKEVERLRKGTQKRAPKYLMMVGLPGAGKSTFSTALERSGAWVRANQDDLGRRGCEELLRRTVPLVRQGKSHLVLDRCHITKAERREWLDALGNPPAKEVTCVFFDSCAQDCKRRAAARPNHPTIRAGGGGRIIDAQAKQLERPETNEGFAAVEVVKSFEEAEDLLRRYGIGPDIATAAAAPAAGPDNLDEASDGPALDDVAVAATGDDSGPGPGDDTAAGQGMVNGSPLQRSRSSPLPGAFRAWLQSALRMELGEADAEGIGAAVEVILSDDSMDSGAGDKEALDAAADVVRDAGALACADMLHERWAELSS